MCNGQRYKMLLCGHIEELITPCVRGGTTLGRSKFVRSMGIGKKNCETVWESLAYHHDLCKDCVKLFAALGFSAHRAHDMVLEEKKRQKIKGDINLRLCDDGKSFVIEPSDQHTVAKAPALNPSEKAARAKAASKAAEQRVKEYAARGGRPVASRAATENIPLRKIATRKLPQRTRSDSEVDIVDARHPPQASSSTPGPSLTLNEDGAFEEIDIGDLPLRRAESAQSKGSSSSSDNNTKKTTLAAPKEDSGRLTPRTRKAVNMVRAWGDCSPLPDTLTSVRPNALGRAATSDATPRRPARSRTAGDSPTVTPRRGPQRSRTMGASRHSRQAESIDYSKDTALWFSHASQVDREKADLKAKGDVLQTQADKLRSKAPKEISPAFLERLTSQSSDITVFTANTSSPYDTDDDDPSSAPRQSSGPRDIFATPIAERVAQNDAIARQRGESIISQEREHRRVFRRDTGALVVTPSAEAAQQAIWNPRDHVAPFPSREGTLDTGRLPARGMFSPRDAQVHTPVRRAPPIPESARITPFPSVDDDGVNLDQESSSRGHRERRHRDGRRHSRQRSISRAPPPPPSDDPGSFLREREMSAIRPARLHSRFGVPPPPSMSPLPISGAENDNEDSKPSSRRHREDHNHHRTHSSRPRSKSRAPPPPGNASDTSSRATKMSSTRSGRPRSESRAPPAPSSSQYPRDEDYNEDLEPSSSGYRLDRPRCSSHRSRPRSESRASPAPTSSAYPRSEDYNEDLEPSSRGYRLDRSRSGTNRNRPRSESRASTAANGDEQTPFREREKSKNRSGVLRHPTLPSRFMMSAPVSPSVRASSSSSPAQPSMTPPSHPASSRAAGLTTEERRQRRRGRHLGDLPPAARLVDGEEAVEMGELPSRSRESARDSCRGRVGERENEGEMASGYAAEEMS